MVRLKKSPLPEGVTINTENDYRKGVAYKLLLRDCYEKCYICEDKKLTSINAEHVRPHENDPKLKFCWGNILLSCSHCNKAKNKYYTSIIDCTKRDPEELITLNIGLFPGMLVEVVENIDDIETLDTAKLLRRVYNGDNPDMLSSECDNLRHRVQQDLKKFQKLLWRYKDLSENDEDARKVKKKIGRELSRKAPFAAFKRAVMRQLPAMLIDFEQYID